jgi:hypothetical protein
VPEKHDLGPLGPAWGRHDRCGATTPSHVGLEVTALYPWRPFDRYVQQQQQHLLEQLQDEQAKALRMGLIADPKSEPHGGYRIACVWPDAVTQPACDLSARVAELLPGTPAYRYDSIHSSVGISPRRAGG